MADAKLVSPPSDTGDGGVASTVPPSTIEGTAAVTAAGGESAIEESEETPEARALAQGPYNYPILPLYYHLPWLYYVDSGVLLCRHESSL